MTQSEVAKTLLSAKKVAIFAHVNPDQDAYGSMFAVRDCLRNMGKEAEIFAVRSPVGYLDEIFPLDEVRTDFIAKNFDLVVVLDFHLEKRLNECFSEEMKKAKNVISIDHHSSIGENGKSVTKKVFVQPEKAAVCEILADIFVENNFEITPKIATYLWTGLIGDTGRFMHSNSSENVFKVASILIEKGAEIQFIYDKVYRNTPVKQVRLQKIFIDKITLVENGEAGYVLFSMKDLKKLNADTEDIKKYTDDIVCIEGVKVSFLGYEIAKNKFRFSIRTNGINCRNFAIKMGGGGHSCAAGFNIDASLRDLKKAMPKWSREILNESK